MEDLIEVITDYNDNISRAYYKKSDDDKLVLLQKGLGCSGTKGSADTFMGLPYYILDDKTIMKANNCTIKYSILPQEVDVDMFSMTEYRKNMFKEIPENDIFEGKRELFEVFYQNEKITVDFKEDSNGTKDVYFENLYVGKLGMCVGENGDSTGIFKHCTKNDPIQEIAKNYNFILVDKNNKEIGTPIWFNLVRQKYARNIEI